MPGFREGDSDDGHASIQTVWLRSATYTFQPPQRVKAALLLAREEAVAIQEVGPGHFDALEGVGAVLPEGVARAAAGFDHLVVLARRGEHGAAHKPYFWGALSVEQAVDDAQEKVLWPGLCLQARPVAEDVGKYCSGAFDKSCFSHDTQKQQ